MKHFILKMLAISFAAAVSTSHALVFGPYNGFSGYQEFRIGSGYYYVAYYDDHGQKGNKAELAWKIRSAQLCEMEKSSHFIELRYPDEPILRGEPEFLTEVDLHGSHFRRAKGGGGGFIFIPMYTGPAGPMLLDSPSKIGHVRCVDDPSRANSPARLLKAVDFTNPKTMEQLE